MRVFILLCLYAKRFVNSSSGTVECPIDGDTSTITKAIEGSSSIVLVVLGFAVGPNKHVVQCLLDGKTIF